MPLPRYAAWIFPVAASIVAATNISAQNYPHKPIRLVTSLPGGTNDFVARMIALRLPDAVGQPVIVDNRGAIFSAETVAKAAPDGYTLLVTASELWVIPLLRKAAYDIERDYAMITMAIRQPTIVVVHPSVPAKSVRELIELSKSRPEGLLYGSATVGSASHTGPELFKLMSGANLTRVPYKSAGNAATGLLGNEIQLIFGTAASTIPFVKSGRLRAIAVTSAEPSALLPELPTVAATVPGYESVTVGGVFAPAKTPASIIKRLNHDIVRLINRPDTKEQLFNAGVEPVGSTPEAFTAKIKSETIRLGKLIKDTGIRAD